MCCANTRFAKKHAPIVVLYISVNSSRTYFVASADLPTAAHRHVQANKKNNHAQMSTPASTKKEMFGGVWILHVPGAPKSTIFASAHGFSEFSSAILCCTFFLDHPLHVLIHTLSLWHSFDVVCLSKLGCFFIFETSFQGRPSLARSRICVLVFFPRALHLC